MIILPYDQSDYDYGLACPKCGCNNLHHGHVTVFTRTEDADKTNVATVKGNSVTVDSVKSSATKNPSSRRHGLRIAFYCENCEEIQDLCIAQHKGTTFMHWDGK